MPSINAADNYLMWTNTVAVTLVSRNRPGVGDTETSIAYALNQKLSRKEVEASAGKYSSLDRVFNIPTTLLGGVIPKVGDRLRVATASETLTVIDGGEGVGAASPLYRVIEAERATWGYRWRLVCSDPVIVYGLRDIITIRRPTIRPGETTGYTYLMQAVKASAQLMNRRGGTEAGYAHLNEEWHIAIAEDASLIRQIQRQDQVVLEDGTPLEIVEVRAEDRLRELSVLVCENEVASGAVSI